MEGEHLEILPRRSRGRGTVRRTVEGRALARVSFDEGKNALDVPEHFSRRDADRQNLVGRHPGITAGIPNSTTAALMRLAIYLHAQLCSITVEIQRVRTRGMLLAPVKPRLLLSQLLPKQHLRHAHRASKFARSAIGSAGAFEHLFRFLPRLWRGPSTMLRMVPLPQQAGGGFWSVQ